MSDKSKSKYWPAEEVKKLAEEKVIPKWHDQLSEAEIEYVFIEDMKAKGVVCLAKTKPAAQLERYFGGGDYVLIVNDAARTHLSPSQKIALIDHELCHCIRDKEGKFKTRTHDVEEFSVVIERHGLWKPDLEEFAEKVQQINLPLAGKAA